MVLLLNVSTPPSRCMSSLMFKPPSIAWGADGEPVKSVRRFQASREVGASGSGEIHSFLKAGYSVTRLQRLDTGDDELRCQRQQRRILVKDTWGRICARISVSTNWIKCRFCVMTIFVRRSARFARTGDVDAVRLSKKLCQYLPLRRQVAAFLRNRGSQ